MNSGFAREEIKEFGWKLRDAAPPSVDFFITARQEFLPIGKAAIAAAIMRLENPETLLHFYEPAPRGVAPKILSSRGWYQTLWEGMLRGCGPVAQDFLDRNNVRFITFNYDRSLEHFLATRFVNMYPGVSARDVLGRFPLVHVHGRVGGYLERDQGRRSYEPSLKGSVKEYSEGLHIAPEEIPVSTQRAIEAALTGANRICFLGFAYDPVNLDKLRIFGATFSGVVVGTTGIDPNERNRIDADLQRRLQGSLGYVLCDSQHKCGEILRHYVL